MTGPAGLEVADRLLEVGKERRQVLREFWRYAAQVLGVLSFEFKALTFEYYVLSSGF